MEKNEFLETDAAAAHLGKQPRTLEWWRTNGKGPRYLPGNPVRYRRADLDAWLDAQVVDPAEHKASKEKP